MGANSLNYNDISVGQALPGIELDVSTSMIVATALASRDYQNVHHDRDQAVALGSQDIFMNVLTTNGLVGRLVTDWTGPAGELKRVNIRLGVPHYAGDRLTLSGIVSAKRVETGEQLLDVDVVGRNSMGNHVTGQVVVAIKQQQKQ